MNLIEFSCLKKKTIKTFDKKTLKRYKTKQI